MEKVVTGIYMINIMQEDLQKGIDFYTKLGLKVIFYIPGKWCELEINGVKVGLCPTKTVDKGRHTGVVFQVENLFATYEFLKKEGMAFLNEPVTATHGIMVSCADPSGNAFDLYQPTHDKVKKTLEEAGIMCADGCKKDDAAGCCKKEAKRSGCC